MRHKPYSKRNAPARGYRYDIPLNARSRMLFRFKEIIEALMDIDVVGFRFDIFLENMGKAIIREYGGFDKAAQRGRTLAESTKNHFLYCENDLLLDFVELMFQTRFFIEHSEWAV